ncbi:MAG: uL15 family ribosomal protein, partial [Nanoarchaeota archaeon]|nr:uL15 family ribosomal protein [Nanoarchaeota archaeon]
MITHKRKKSGRYRGGTTHGCGSMKKRRGKGNKGGAGMAGTGKRGDSRKPSIWKKEYFGKHGFKRKGLKEKINAINISDVEEKLLSKSVKEGGVYSIDLGKLGYNKLLGKGKVNNKLKISVKYA